MYTIKENKKRMSVQIQRLLMMMVAIIVASMTVTACLEDENSEENNEENGGNGGGGISGKRLKTTVTTSGTMEPFRGEYTYNSDGTLKRIDYYDVSTSKLSRYTVITSNSDGTVAKEELFDTWGDWVINYTSWDNKRPLKAEGYSTAGGVKIPVTFDFTYQNGRLTRFVQKTGTQGDYSYRENKYEPVYDSNGRRTSTTETDSSLGQRKFTRTYNSDGTLQKVTTDGYAGYQNTNYTVTYTWENGKTTVDSDVYATF